MAERSCEHCDEPYKAPRAPCCPLQCGSPKCKAFHTAVVDKAVKPVVWLLGGPSSGKKTLCKLIVERYGFVQISIGDLLREEFAKRKSTRTNKMKEIMRDYGELPNELVMEIVRDRILATLEAPGFLVKGYPRQLQHWRDFERMISPPSAVLYIDTSESTLLARQRLPQHPPVGAAADDPQEVARRAISTFLKRSDEMMAQYHDQIQKVNGEASPDEIFIEIARILDPIVTESEVEVERRRICKKKEPTATNRI